MKSIKNLSEGIHTENLIPFIGVSPLRSLRDVYSVIHERFAERHFQVAFSYCSIFASTQSSCIKTCCMIVFTSIALFFVCSSSLVTLARPSTSSSLRITDRSFQYASPRLWNQLNSTQLNSTENYGRRCLTPLSPHRNYVLS